MNAPIATPALLEARPLRVRTNVPSDDAGGRASPSPLERLEASVDHLARLMAGARGYPSLVPTDFTRLFAALCLASGVDLSVRRLSSAVPVDPASTGPVPMGAAETVRAMANLGFRARSSRSRAPLALFGVLGSAVPATDRGPSLFVPADPGGEAAVIFACPEGGGQRIVRGDGPSEPVTARTRLGRGIVWSFTESTEHNLAKAQRAHTGSTWFRALLASFEQAGLALIACSLAAALVAVLIPLFTIQTYAQVISLGSAEPLPGFVVGMLIAVGIEMALLSRRKSIVAYLANRVEYLIGTMSFERILKIRASISERAAVTDQAARLRTVENIRDFATGPAFASILEAPASFCSIVAVAILTGWVAVFPVIAIALHLTVFALMRRQARIMTSIAADESTEMQRITIETFEKRDAIREAGLQHLWSERMIACARRQQRAQTRLRLIGARADSLSTLVLMAGTVMLLVGGTQAAWAGTIGAGGLLAIVILGLRALTPFHTLCLSIQRFEQFSNSVRQINQLMDLAPEREEGRDYNALKSLGGGVSFLNAGFRAADTRPVFVGFDLEVEPGNRVAITGANGTGKTTILKLVMGLSDLALGALRIDGVDLRQLAVDDLRRRIAYIPEQPRLFPGSVRENLLFASPLASEAKLERAVELAELAEPVGLLPGGLDHVLTASEIAGLPAEFVFKVAIAQAILVESKLLLVDEIPNALLDGPVGQLVRRLIAGNGKRYTVIYVSHRSDFLELAERVVALRYGRVPQVTTPQRLLERVVA